MTVSTPAEYEAWYHTPRGSWIGNTEFTLLKNMMCFTSSETLLDVGCGTGYFSRRFAESGLQVTGLDPDQSSIEYARSLDGSAHYINSSAQSLPFADKAFDYCVAVTSLCFINEPEKALQEMWRVSRRGMVLGLLNRHSTLFLQKKGRGGYRGARWDTVKTARSWWQILKPEPQVSIRSAVFFPGGSLLARGIEKLLPDVLPWGGFLAIGLHKPL